MAERNRHELFDDKRNEAGHGRRSLRSGAVSIVSRAVNAVIQIGSVLFLARLLSPEDYGLVGMVTAITGFAPVLVDLGTRDAVAQRGEITEQEVSSLFWITSGVGTLFAILVSCCGPLIARFYGEPRLTMITLVSSLTFVAAALSCQHYALLRRAMRFQDLGMIDIASNLLSAGCAIALGFYGLHYWALVLRPVLMNVLVTIGVWWRCAWFPSRPVMTSGVKEMLKLGIHGVGFTMTDFAGRSADKVAIGYRAGAAQLGFYQQTLFVYENMLDILVVPLHGVAVSSLSKVRDDLKELVRLWSKALSTLSFYSMPAFGVLAVTSQDIVGLLLGPKWTQAGILLSVLALRGMPHTVERTLGWLHVSAGRTDRWMRWGVVASCVQLGALLLGLPFGSMGVIVSYVVVMYALFVPAIAYAGKPLEIGARDVIRAVWRPLAGALLATIPSYLLRYTLLADVPPIARIALLTLIYLAIYGTLSFGVFRLWQPVQVILALAKDVLPARVARWVPMPRCIENHG